jgi:hypothetical protein
VLLTSVRTTGTAVELVQSSGVKIRAWRWEGTMPDGGTVILYVAGFAREEDDNAVMLSAAPPEPLSSDITNLVDGQVTEPDDDLI